MSRLALVAVEEVSDPTPASYQTVCSSSLRRSLESLPDVGCYRFSLRAVIGPVGCPVAQDHDAPPRTRLYGNIDILQRWLIQIEEKSSALRSAYGSSHLTQACKHSDQDCQGEGRHNQPITCVEIRVRQICFKPTAQRGLQQDEDAHDEDNRGCGNAAQMPYRIAMHVVRDPCRTTGTRSSLRRKSPIAKVLNHQTIALALTKSPKNEKISENIRPTAYTPCSHYQY